MLTVAARWPAALCLIAIVGASVVIPAAGVLVEIARGVRAGGLGDMMPAVSPLVRSLAFALAIGVLATLMAWPVAWRIYHRSGRWLALALTPLIAPGYLAYAGLGLLIAPRTWLGDLLLGHGGSWPTLANRAIAVLALALWTWPVACLALCLALRRLDAWMFDALRLEPGSLLSRWRFKLGVARGAIAMSIVMVAFVMLGSVTPLHLARVGTYAIELWAELAATPAGEQWRVQLAAWPLVLGAMVGAGVVFVGLSRWAARHSTMRDGPASRSRWWWAAPIGGVLVSIGVPAALLAFDLTRVRVPGESTSIFEAIEVFLRVHGDAVIDSLVVSGVVLGACVVIGLCVSLLEYCAARRSWVAQIAGLCLLVSALLPGVLVGSAMLRTFNGIHWLRPVLDVPAIVALGHVARYGFIPAMVAIWVARTTPPDLAALRRLDGADTPGGWWRTAMPGQAAPILVAALVAAALSLHEVESAVMLAPPGSDSLARRMLEMLHFARLRELTAGTLVLLGAGLAAGLILVGLGGFAGSRRTVVHVGP